MKGDDDVLEALNGILTSELTAINQYYIHYKMCENWGYGKLAGRKRGESIDQMKFADKVIERILFLEGVPNMQRLNAISVGEDVPEQFRLDMALQSAASTDLNRSIALCRGKEDNASRELLEDILCKEEEALDWTESQLEIVETIGRERYLAEQMHS